MLTSDWVMTLPSVPVPSLCRSGRLQPSWRCLIMGRSRTSPLLRPWGTPAPWLAPATRTPRRSTTAPSPSHPTRRRKRTAQSGSSWRGAATRVSTEMAVVGLRGAGGLHSYSCSPWAKHRRISSSQLTLCQEANKLFYYFIFCSSVVVHNLTVWLISQIGFWIYKYKRRKELNISLVIFPGHWH